MRSDLNGCSTTAAGQEQYEFFYPRHGGERVQYDYRTPKGALFSCVAESLELARARRDAWVARETWKGAL